MKNHKDTFLLSYFSVTKSTKSHQRERSPLFENSSRVHELVAGAVRGECVRQGIKQKSVVLPLSAISYCHACEHITRDSRADSCTHCLHARIIGLAGVGGVCALTGRRVYFLFCLFAVLGLYLVGVGAIDDPHGRGINTYAEHVCRRRRDRGELTDFRICQHNQKSPLGEEIFSMHIISLKDSSWRR